MTGFVYAIGVPGADRVKIGFATNPARRLQGLRCGSAEDLRIIGTTAGDRTLEKHLHARFSFARIRGEWFELVGSVADFVRGLAPFKMPERASRKDVRGQSAATANVIAKCGGPIAVAEMCGVHVTRVYRWTYDKDKGGTGGFIPTRHQNQLLDAAREKGIALSPADFFTAHGVAEPASEPCT